MTQVADLSRHRVLALPIAPLHIDERRVRRAGENRMFELSQPRTGGKSQRGEAVLCHVDVRFLLDGIGETGYVVVDEAPANTKSRLVVQNILRRCERGA